MPRSAKRLHDGTKLNKTTAMKRQRHNPVSHSATTDEAAKQEHESVDETSEQGEDANASQQEEETNEEQQDDEADEGDSSHSSDEDYAE